MMSLTFGLFTQVSGSGPLGPLVNILFTKSTFNSPKTCLALVTLGLPKYAFHLSILGEIISNGHGLKDWL